MTSSAGDGDQTWIHLTHTNVRACVCARACARCERSQKPKRRQKREHLRALSRSPFPCSLFFRAREREEGLGEVREQARRRREQGRRVRLGHGCFGHPHLMSVVEVGVVEAGTAPARLEGA